MYIVPELARIDGSICKLVLLGDWGLSLELLLM